jgi:hypothetical protein
MKKTDHCFECERSFSEVLKSKIRPFLCVLCATRLLIRENAVEELIEIFGEKDGTAA